MSETMLSERIQALADDIPAPPVSSYDDLARGRRRARRRWAGVTAGSLALVTGAVAVGVAVSSPGPSERTVADPAAQRAEQPAAVRPAPAALSDRLVALGRGNGHAITVADVLAVASALEDRVDGPLGWLSVGAAATWQATGADTCPAGWTCEDVRVRGADRARWAQAGTVHQLVVDFDGRVDVFTVNQADVRPTEVAWVTP